MPKVREGPKQVSLRVLVACEFSGVVRNAFLARGHDAWSCDVLPALHGSEHQERHLQQNVAPLLKEKWDIVIAHPPCTYLANSGVQHLKDVGRQMRMLDAVDFFLACLNANAPHVCVENPVHHKYAREAIGSSATQYIQPYQFGEANSKKTGLWLKGLPQLVPTRVVDKPRLVGKARHSRQYLKALDYRDTLQRQLSRSIFSSGIAEAMAEQWGSYVRGQKHAEG